MPRFNSNRWKPTDDTTPGLRTVDPTCIVLAIQFDASTNRFGCPCGCNGWPKGRATFAMGHDARMRGKLIRAHLMGVRVRHHCDGILMEPVSAMEVAEKYDWKEYLDAAVLRREGKNREVLARAIGSDRMIKVGRWDYTGQVVAVYRTNDQDMLQVEYVNKAGEVKTARVPASEAPITEGA